MTPATKKAKKAAKTISVTPVRSERAKASSSVATPKKAAAKRVTPKASGPVSSPKAPEQVQPRVRALNEHGFTAGSDSALIVDELLKGGSTRVEINDRIASVLNGKTRYGNPKNVSSLVSSLLTRLAEKGYRVEQTWRLVAPDDVKAPVTGDGVTRGVVTPTATKRRPMGAPGRGKKPVTRGTDPA